MELEDHEWPTDSAGHMWSRWMSQKGPPESTFTKYRVCVHPDCQAFEEAPA